MYLFAQFLGGFLAAGVIYGNYISAIDAYEGYNVRTGKLLGCGGDKQLNELTSTKYPQVRQQRVSFLGPLNAPSTSPPKL